MKTIVTITKTLEDWWGLDDLWDGRADNDPVAIRETIDRVQEDISALIYRAKWTVKRVEE